MPPEQSSCESSNFREYFDPSFIAFEDAYGLLNVLHNPSEIVPEQTSQRELNGHSRRVSTQNTWPASLKRPPQAHTRFIIAVMNVKVRQTLSKTLKSDLFFFVHAFIVMAFSDGTRIVSTLTLRRQCTRNSPKRSVLPAASDHKPLSPIAAAQLTYTNS